jgi:hypothetical protein
MSSSINEFVYPDDGGTMFFCYVIRLVLPLAPKTRLYTLDESCRYSQQDGELNLTKMYGYRQCVHECQGMTLRAALF